MLNQQKSSGLLKVLGIGFGVAVVIGNSIGSGILRMPGTVASYLSNPWLIILLWVLGGCLSIIGAVIYAEAGTAYPFTGGPYAISEKVFGKQAGFTVGICDWILNAASNGALAIAGAEYINSLGGWQAYTSLSATAIVIVLSAIQWFGIRSSSAIQQGLSLLKALGLLLLVAAFFIHGKSANAAPAIHPATAPVAFFAAFTLSLRAILFTYASWNAPIYFSEENTDARHNLPRSLIYGVLALTIIYVLVNVSVLYLLPVASIAGSALAVGDGAAVVFGPVGKTVVTVISIVIVLSSLYAGILYTPRIIFGVSRSGLFPVFMSGLNRFHIPGLALIVTTAVTVAFTLSGTFIFIISIYTFLYIFIDTSVYLSAIYSRFKNKDAIVYKAPGYPVTHIFMILVNTALLVSVFKEDRQSSMYAVLIILLTVPFYFFVRMIMKDSAIAS